MRRKAAVAILLAVGVAAGLLFAGVFNAPAPELGAAEAPAAVTAEAAVAATAAPESAEELAELRDFAGKFETLFATAAEAVKPAVVSIQSERTVRVRYRDPLEEFFRSPFFEDRRRPQRPPQERERRERGVGSGVILDEEGHILTNNHVIAGADKLTVVLPGGRNVEAELVGRDDKTDLAVIKLTEEVDDLPAVKLGDSDRLRIGQWVLAIGSPFQLPHTVSAGIVSATGRSGLGVTQYEDWIQTDAAINPGNSGGPLVNLEGEVVGINTFIVSRAGGNLGIGFAVPINMVKDVLDELIAGKEVVRGYLGVQISDLTPELAEQFEYEGNGGALVHHVYEDSPAGEAGIQPGDIIIEYEGHPVGNQGELRRRAAATEPGTKAELKVWRDGKEVTLTVAVGNLAEAETGGIGPDEPDWLGISAQTLTGEMAERLGNARLKGVLIADIKEDGRAARAGIEPGDVVLSVNRRQVTSVAEYRRLIGQTSEQTGVLLRVLDADRGVAHWVLIRGSRR